MLADDDSSEASEDVCGAVGRSHMAVSGGSSQFWNPVGKERRSSLDSGRKARRRYEASPAAFYA